MPIRRARGPLERTDVGTIVLTTRYSVDSAPSPRQSHHDAPHGGISCARDAVFMPHLPALIGRQRESDERPQLAAITDLTPPEDLRG